MKNTVYNIFQLITLKEGWDGQRLETTFKQLIQRHESLRTSFHLKDQQPIQRIHDSVDFSIFYDDSGDLRRHVRPFDLTRAPLLRVGVVKKRDGSDILLVDMHHIISDGVSIEVIISDFRAIYAGESLPPLSLRYRDFAEWQSNRKDEENLRNQENFWLNRFAGDIPVLALPLDFPRPTVRNFEGRRTMFELNVEDVRSVKTIADGQGATLYMVLLALINILLSKLTSQEDIVVGTPIAGRRHVDLENIIGMFVNTLALRNFPAGDATFIQFLNQVKEQTFSAFENQDYQFEDLVEQASVNRDTSRNPIFDVLYTLRVFDYDKSGFRGPTGAWE